MHMSRPLAIAILLKHLPESQDPEGAKEDPCERRGPLAVRDWKVEWLVILKKRFGEKLLS